MRRWLLLVLLVVPCLGLTFQCDPLRDADVILEPGGGSGPDGTYTFAEFQTLLDTATDVNGDDTIKIGLRSGVEIVNAADSTHGQIEIPHDNVWICGETTGTVSVVNQRIGPSNGANSAFLIDGMTKIKLWNLDIATLGQWGFGIFASDSTTFAIRGLSIQTYGDEAYAIRLWGGVKLESCAFCTLTTRGMNSHGLAVVKNSGALEMIGVEIRRSAAATADAVAIWASNCYGLGGYEYFNSANINSVTVCSEPGCTHRWEDHSQGAAIGILADEIFGVVSSPLSHNPYDPNTPGPYGAQTFPFDDHGGTGLQLGLQGGAVAGQNIRLGGTCGVPDETDVYVQAGTYTFAEFQTILDDAVAAGDTTGNGLVDVFLLDGCHILNAADSNNPRIEIPGDDVRIFAVEGSDVSIRNERMGSDGTESGVIYLDGKEGVQIENVSLSSLGDSGRAIEAYDFSDITCMGLTIETEGAGGLGILLWDSQLTGLYDTTIKTAGSFGYGLELLDSSSVEAMDDVEIIRSASATADTVAISVAFSVDAYFNTANINNVTVCSEPGCLHKWEDHANGVAGLLSYRDFMGETAPTTHTPFSGDPNVTHGPETFPFDDHGGTGIVPGPQGGAVAGKNIVLGGTCE